MSEKDIGDKKYISLVDIQRIQQNLKNIDEQKKDTLKEYLQTAMAFLEKKYPTHLRSTSSNTKVEEKLNTTELPAKIPQDKKIQTFKCGICLDDIDRKDMKVTNCMHKFHASCLQRWVDEFDAKTKAPTCPSCRTRLFTNNHNHRHIHNARLTQTHLITRIFNIGDLAEYNFRRDKLTEALRWYRRSCILIDHLFANYTVESGMKENLEALRDSYIVCMQKITDMNRTRRHVSQSPRPIEQKVNNPSSTISFGIYNGQYRCVISWCYLYDYYFKQIIKTTHPTCCYHCRQAFKPKNAIFVRVIINNNDRKAILVHKKCIIKSSGTYLRPIFGLSNKKGYQIRDLISLPQTHNFYNLRYPCNRTFSSLNVYDKTIPSSWYEKILYFVGLCGDKVQSM